MTPGQARSALVCFLMLLAGVTVNALFLQAAGPSASVAKAPVSPSRTAAEPRAQGPVRPVVDRTRKAPEPPATNRPKPRASNVVAEEQPTLRIARFAPDMTQVESSAAAGETAPADTVRAIQRELKQRGYGPIAADGKMDLRTRAAIMAFEHDAGQPLKGMASDELLKTLLLGAPTAPALMGTRKTASVQAEETIRIVQQGLLVLGYRTARPDGRLGEDTVKAIRELEMDKGLVPKGRVSAEVVAQLSEAMAPAKTVGR